MSNGKSVEWHMNVIINITVTDVFAKDCRIKEENNMVSTLGYNII